MWIHNVGEYWNCQHGLMLSRSRGECFSDTQSTVRSQEGRNFRNLSNDDLKTFLLSHTPYFPRHLFHCNGWAICLWFLTNQRCLSAPPIFLKRLTGDRFCLPPGSGCLAVCVCVQRAPASALCAGTLISMPLLQWAPAWRLCPALVSSISLPWHREPFYRLLLKGAWWGTGHFLKGVLLWTLTSARLRNWLWDTEAYIKCIQPQCCKKSVFLHICVCTCIESSEYDFCFASLNYVSSFLVINEQWR